MEASARWQSRFFLFFIAVSVFSTFQVQTSSLRAATPPEVKAHQKKKKKKVKGSANKFLSPPLQPFMIHIFNSGPDSKPCLSVGPDGKPYKGVAGCLCCSRNSLFQPLFKVNWERSSEPQSEEIKHWPRRRSAITNDLLSILNLATPSFSSFIFFFFFCFQPTLPSSRVVQLWGVSQEVAKVFTFCTWVKYLCSTLVKVRIPLLYSSKSQKVQDLKYYFTINETIHLSLKYMLTLLITILHGA